MKQAVFTFLHDSKCSFLTVIKTCETTNQLKVAFQAFSETVFYFTVKTDL